MSKMPDSFLIFLSVFIKQKTYGIPPQVVQYILLCYISIFPAVTGEHILHQQPAYLPASLCASLSSKISGLIYVKWRGAGLEDGEMIPWKTRGTEEQRDRFRDIYPFLTLPLLASALV